MKLTNLLVLMLLVLPFAASAQDDDSGKPTMREYQLELDDPDLDFTQFKNKETKAEMKKGKLKLESDREKYFVVSTSMVRKADPGQNYVMFGAGVKFSDFNDKHKSGIVFNYRNDDNFHALVFDKKNYYYLIRERGDSYIEQRGQYKSKKKSNTIVPSVLISGNKVQIFVDGLELAVVKLRKRMRNKGYGFYTDGKSSIEVSGPLAFGIMPMDIEEDEDEDDDYDGRRKSRSRDYDDE